MSCNRHHQKTGNNTEKQTTHDFSHRATLTHSLPETTTEVLPSWIRIGITFVGLKSSSGADFTNTATIGDFSQGGGLYKELGTAIILNTRIVGNTTKDFVAEGGGLGSRSDTLMENCEISDNKTLASSSGGGGIYTSTTITLRQCTISENTVGATPGTGVDGYSVGGAFANVGISPATFENCTITRNSAPHGVGQGPEISSLSTGEISSFHSHRQPRTSLDSQTKLQPLSKSR